MKKTLLTLVAVGMVSTASFGASTSACVACHGSDFEKAALGKSKIVKDMTKADIVAALKGYKDGSYGGAMKATMTGQVANLSDADMEDIANQIVGGGAEAPTAEAPKTNIEKKVEDATKATTDTATKEVKEKAKKMIDTVKQPVGDM